MPKYQLMYFDAKGRAELARWLFAAAGQEYEDKRLTFEEWAVIKPSTFGIWFHPLSINYDKPVKTLSIEQRTVAPQFSPGQYQLWKLFAVVWTWQISCNKKNSYPILLAII